MSGKKNSAVASRRNRLGNNRKSQLVYLTEDEHDLLSRAAKAKRTSKSGFIANAALELAESIIAAEKKK